VPLTPTQNRPCLRDTLIIDVTCHLLASFSIAFCYFCALLVYLVYYVLKLLQWRFSVGDAASPGVTRLVVKENWSTIMQCGKVGGQKITK